MMGKNDGPAPAFHIRIVAGSYSSYAEHGLLHVGILFPVFCVLSSLLCTL
jgi:hypothetical protein